MFPLNLFTAFGYSSTKPSTKTSPSAAQEAATEDQAKLLDAFQLQI